MFLPPLNGELARASKVFFNGSLYWDCLEGYILVCHLNINHKHQPYYELIKGPQAPLGRCLWKSENKLHCYCHGFEDKFPEWTLQQQEIMNSNWKLEEGSNNQFTTLCEGVSEFIAKNKFGVGKGQKPLVNFKVIA